MQHTATQINAAYSYTKRQPLHSPHPCIRNSENFSKLRSVNYMWTRALQSVLLKLYVWNHWQSEHSTASMCKRTLAIANITAR